MTTQSRGYGYAHRMLREKWAKRVARGGVACARCGQTIDPREEWHLDHDSYDRSRYVGVSHAYCNTVEPAHRRRKQKQPRAANQSSRRW